MNSKINAFTSGAVSLSVFLLSALALVVPSGYSVGAVILLVFALGYLWVRPYPELGLQDFYIIAALAGYFVVGATTNFIHHLPHNSYDNISRFLLVIPVFLLLVRLSIKPIYCWSGIAVGATGSGIFACWDFYTSGDRADGFTNAIQFGDIAIIFACMLLAGLPWARAQSRLVTALFLCGVAGGFAASLLSGSRGGWLVLPAVMALLYGCGNHRRVKKTSLLIVSILIAASVVYFFSTSDILRDRITDIFLEVHGYETDKTINTSVGARLYMWKTSFAMIEQRPLLGWGSLANYLAETGIHDEILADFNHVHNDFLDAWVKRGFLGAMVLLAIYLLPALAFYSMLKQSSPGSRAAAMAGIVLVTGTFICGLTQTFFAHSSGVMIYLFMLVILWSQARRPIDANKSQ